MNIDTSLPDRNPPTDDIRWAPSAEMSRIVFRPTSYALRRFRSEKRKLDWLERSGWSHYNTIIECKGRVPPGEASRLLPLNQLSLVLSFSYIRERLHMNLTLSIFFFLVNYRISNSWSSIPKSLTAVENPVLASWNIPCSRNRYGTSPVEARTLAALVGEWIAIVP